MKKTLLTILPLAVAISFASCKAPNAPTQINKSVIETNQRKVADWMLAHRQETSGGRHKDNQWTIAAWYTGVFSFYEQTKDPRYLEPLMAMEKTVGWKVGDNRFFGDDQAISQVYLDIYRKVKKDPLMIADIKAVVDEQISLPDPGLGAHKAALFGKG
ncbi:MAG: glycoside hydrolase family 88 protein, partial [Holophagales bacterium]|nr:glycoside hydrolase family 88 protein [Holophagales bacterium]